MHQIRSVNTVSKDASKKKEIKVIFVIWLEKIKGLTVHQANTFVIQAKFRYAFFECSDVTRDFFRPVLGEGKFEVCNVQKARTDSLGYPAIL